MWFPNRFWKTFRPTLVLYRSRTLVLIKISNKLSNQKLHWKNSNSEYGKHRPSYPKLLRNHIYGIYNISPYTEIMKSIRTFTTHFTPATLIAMRMMSVKIAMPFMIHELVMTKNSAMDSAKPVQYSATPTACANA